MSTRTQALAVIGDREALAWVLAERRVAFPFPRYPAHFPRLHAGDSLYLYTTRGCFKNPTRDRGRVIGRATLRADLHEASEPVHFGDGEAPRAFPLEADLDLEALAPRSEGVELGALISRLSIFPKADNWAAYMRRSAIPLTEADAQLLDAGLIEFAPADEAARQSYLPPFTKASA